jgi:outer membrane lipoprotein-sorting protein
MIVEQEDGTMCILDVVIKTDNDLNNIKFVWLLTDINNDYLNNGIINGVNNVNAYEYVCYILNLTPQNI